MLRPDRVRFAVLLDIFRGSNFCYNVSGQVILLIIDLLPLVNNVIFFEEA